MASKSEPISEILGAIYAAAAGGGEAIFSGFGRTRGAAGAHATPKAPHALALVEMEFSTSTELFTLRDAAQEDQLDAALKLTMPSLKKGSKKTPGEEQVALKKRKERESMPAPAAAARRGAPTDRSSAAQAQKAQEEAKRAKIQREKSS